MREFSSQGGIMYVSLPLIFGSEINRPSSAFLLVPGTESAFSIVAYLLHRGKLVLQLRLIKENWRPLSVGIKMASD